MKKTIITTAFALAVVFANAQIIVYSGDQVGVCSTTTTTPSYSFQVTTGDEGITAGNMDIHTSTDGYKIGGNYMLWNNGKSACTYVGFAGSSGNTGVNNSFVGHQAGAANTSGLDNTFLGHYSGYESTGSYNTFLGLQAGYYNTNNYNTLVGVNAGFYNTSGEFNPNFTVAGNKSF